MDKKSLFFCHLTFVKHCDFLFLYFFFFFICILFSFFFFFKMRNWRVIMNVLYSHNNRISFKREKMWNKQRMENKKKRTFFRYSYYCLLKWNEAKRNKTTTKNELNKTKSKTAKMRINLFVVPPICTLLTSNLSQVQNTLLLGPELCSVEGVKSITKCKIIIHWFIVQNDYNSCVSCCCNLCDKFSFIITCYISIQIWISPYQ